MKDAKQMISVRIDEDDRLAVQALANRLYVRESDIYRFAINHLIHHYHCLLDFDCCGGDLLIQLIDIRYELINTLGLRKHQLEKIINNGNCQPEKYVSMADMELFFMPSHILKQHLLKLYASPQDKVNLESWLKEYLSNKYNPIAY